MKSIYEFEDYKFFTHARIASLPNDGRGARVRMAKAMGCQVAYVSHVLAGDRHLSLEQGEALGRFFELRSDETEYFLLLIELARAGTMTLRSLLQSQIDRRRKDHQVLKGRVNMKAAISPADEARYYSSWHYQAIRMLLTIAGFSTTKAIAKRLALPIERVSEVLSFFLELGLIREEENRYVTTEKQIHLGSDSPLISKLHTNWRVHTLQSLDRTNLDDLHYSAAVTLSEKDFFTVRELLVKGLLQSLEVIKPSPEEKLCVMAIDFYEL